MNAYLCTQCINRAPVTKHLHVVVNVVRKYSIRAIKCVWIS